MADDPAAPEPTTEDDAVDADAEVGAPAGDADLAEAADSDAAEPTDDAEAEAEAGAKTSAKGTEAKGTDAKAAPAVVRKKVVSKRVTPKGGPQSAKSGATGPRTKVSAKADAEEAGYSKRYTPPAPQYAAGPSPWWVPTLMFGLLIIGALVIMLNYSGVFGEPQNIRLVIGLAFILGGIVTATQYR